MVTYKILIFLMALGWSATASEIAPLNRPFVHPQCPRVDDPYKTTLLPYPYDCSKYYSCLNGLAYLRQCPGNFLWNPLNQLCDYAENVQCSQQSTELPPQPSGDIVSYRPYPNDCNRYYRCEAKLCPPSYYWNSYKQQCDLPEMAQCPYAPVMPPTITPQPPTIPTAGTVPPVVVDPTAGEECQECNAWCLGQGHIYLPYPQDCRKFIQCNGLAYIHNCPNQLLWNDVLKTCDRFCIGKNTPIIPPLAE